MFNDVDDTLRAVLTHDVPIPKSDVDIAFDRPTREWASRLSKPTLNLFLYDVRERLDLKDDEYIVTRDADGRAVKRRPPRRIDLAFLVTAWTKDPQDEHRILGRVLACMYRQNEVDPEYLQGDLKSAAYPVTARVTPADEVMDPTDLWGVLDNDLHAALSWVWTVPLDAFKPETGPLVRSREIRVGAVGEEWRETITRIGGLVHRKGDRLSGLAGTRVTVLGTGFQAVTDADGHFSFTNLPAGRYTLRVQPPEGKPREQTIVVPSATYDLEVDD